MPLAPSLAVRRAVTCALVAILATGCVTEDHNLDLPPAVPDLGVPPADSVTKEELPDVTPPDVAHDVSFIITSYLQIVEGVRIKVDGRYLVRRRPDGSSVFDNLNAYEWAGNFGAAVRLPPGFAKLELVTVDGEVVATHDAPPRSEIEDYVEHQLIVWGTRDDVHTTSWGGRSTDGDPTTLEYSVENLLTTPIGLVRCGGAPDCVQFAEVAPGETYTGKETRPSGDSISISFKLDGEDLNWAGFTAHVNVRCQFEHALVHSPYGPGVRLGSFTIARGCVGY